MSPPPATGPFGGLKTHTVGDLPGRLRRGILRRRRLLAALLSGIAVATSIRALAPPPEPSVVALVAAHDLPAGTTLGADDVRAVAFRPGTVPDGLEPDPQGRILAAPVRRGEPITQTRLVDPSLTAGLPGVVAAPVRLPDAAMVSLLRAGDRIDLLAADPQGGPPEVVAHAARVLGLPAATAGDPLPGRLVLLGLDAAEVPVVAGASVTHFLSVAYSG
ncbi:SAF domain-containing protein [Nocardioides sp.]|uniref:SAF domain-containing protein n=1 Tax=Nocardioides sp. TaxID=35761 RepID=UPI003564D0DB